MSETGCGCSIPDFGCSRVPVGAPALFGHRPERRGSLPVGGRSGPRRIVADPDSLPQVWGGFRRIRVRRFPYVLFFKRLDAQTVGVYAVAHTSRRPGYWRRRRMMRQKLGLAQWRFLSIKCSGHSSSALRFQTVFREVAQLALRRAAGIVRPRCRMGTLARPDF